MNTDNREIALKKLVKLASKKKEFWYKHICEYALGHRLSGEDRIWLYKRLKEKNITILGKDPTEEPTDMRKLWHDKDGSEYLDWAHNDYESVYAEISRTCDALKPLVEKARNIKPPQWGEGNQLDGRLREGDESARSRLIEMYLRTALALGLKWSKALDVDLEDAVGDACEGLVKAANRYDPDTHDLFPTYCVNYIYYSIVEAHAIHNWPMVKKHSIFFAKAYCLLKENGCFECERLIQCNKAIRQLAEKLQCEPEESRKAILAALEPLSLDNLPEGAVQDGYVGQSDDDTECEMGQPGLCVDASFEVETEMDDRLLRQKLQDCMCLLNPQEKQVLELSNGLFGLEQQKLKDIGNRYGVTRQRVFQIEKRAMKKLRTQGSGLKDYL